MTAPVVAQGLFTILTGCGNPVISPLGNHSTANEAASNMFGSGLTPRKPLKILCNTLPEKNTSRDTNQTIYRFKIKQGQYVLKLEKDLYGWIQFQTIQNKIKKQLKLVTDLWF